MHFYSIKVVKLLVLMCVEINVGDLVNGYSINHLNMLGSFLQEVTRILGKF